MPTNRSSPLASAVPAAAAPLHSPTDRKHRCLSQRAAIAIACLSGSPKLSKTTFEQSLRRGICSTNLSLPFSPHHLTPGQKRTHEAATRRDTVPPFETVVFARLPLHPSFATRTRLARAVASFAFRRESVHSRTTSPRDNHLMH
jgi:hypothetical protein